MVDIIFTRAGNLARIKVAVLDPKKIPQTLEVVFGKYLHAIYFIVEEGDGSGAHSSADQDKDPMDEDDDLLKVPEQSKHMDNQVNVIATQCADLPSEAWYRKQAECILGNVVDVVLDEIASHVMQEDDAEVNTRLPTTPCKRVWPQTPIRGSKRREATADEDSLDRAERLVAMKNLEIPAKNGKNFNNSVLSISDNAISSNLNNVGISLGSNENDIFRSISEIKSSELDKIHAN
ncbi:unnamed protein product [Miscanthus lutarioriparius]|uniref:Uncharacterized protein n=1 Tax=Miscanthus lutarioriparius TaxID=422564 RepID=A0A811QJ84_9POAL|nr:unnamed protein product [Miscanthus lutarioriparius]